MQALKSSSIFSTNTHLINYSLKPNSLVFLLFHSSTSTSVSNPFLFNFLVKDLDFTETQALSLCKRYPHASSFEKACSVANYFQSLGFSNSQIASSVRSAPHILVADIEKTLKPKFKFLQDLGLEESRLGKFISRSSTLLTSSLEKRLKPNAQFLGKFFGDDNEKLLMVLLRSNGLLATVGILKLSNNIEYLKSCGIVGSQLSNLLLKQPRIFRMRESALRDLVSRAVDMGFSTDSRMLVHGIHTLDGLSEKVIKKKWELIKSFGFSEDDCIKIFRNSPRVFMVSEEKLKLRIEFYMNVAKLDKNVLVTGGFLLTLSLQYRVIPRYRVLQIMKSKNLVKNDASFVYILKMTEDKFLKFMSKFPNDMEELLNAYKGHLIDTSSSSSTSDEEEI